jgi:hypothetical protein
VTKRRDIKNGWRNWFEIRTSNWKKEKE